MYETDADEAELGFVVTELENAKALLTDALTVRARVKETDSDDVVVAETLAAEDGERVVVNPVGVGLWLAGAGEGVLVRVIAAVGVIAAVLVLVAIGVAEGGRRHIGAMALTVL